MSELEKLYDKYHFGDFEFRKTDLMDRLRKDSFELIDSISDRELSARVEDVYAEGIVEYEKYGFVNGYKTAVRMIIESMKS